MRKLGQNPSEEELIEMISSVDDNGDHEIDFDELYVNMLSRLILSHNPCCLLLV